MFHQKKKHKTPPSFFLHSHPLFVASCHNRQTKHELFTLFYKSLTLAFMIKHLHVSVGLVHGEKGHNLSQTISSQLYLWLRTFSCISFLTHLFSYLRCSNLSIAQPQIHRVLYLTAFIFCNLTQKTSLLSYCQKDRRQQNQTSAHVYDYMNPIMTHNSG